MENDFRDTRKLFYGVSMISGVAAMALVLMLTITIANVAILENMANIKASICVFVGQVTLRY